MIDLSDIVRSKSLVFLNILMVLVLYFLLKNVFVGKYISKTNKRIAICLLFLFCLFSFWGGDWFHYQESFPIVKAFGGGHMEPVYISIIQFVPDYFTFRVVVWGCALFFVLNTLKRCHINYPMSLFIFVFSGLIWMSYARVSLAMAMMFYGASLVIKPSVYWRRCSIITGVLLVGGSYFFHKTALFGISIIIFAYIMTKYTSKRILVLLLLATPLVWMLIQSLLFDFMLEEANAEDGMFDASVVSGQRYLGAENATKGIAARLMKYLECIPYYMTAYICLKVRYIKSISYTLTQDNIMFMNIAFICVFLASIFAFDLGVATDVLYSRFLRYGFIPCTIVLTLALDISETYKLAKWTIYFAICSTSYSLLYSYYLAR